MDEHLRTGLVCTKDSLSAFNTSSPRSRSNGNPRVRGYFDTEAEANGLLCIHGRASEGPRHHYRFP